MRSCRCQSQRGTQPVAGGAGTPPPRLASRPEEQPTVTKASRRTTLLSIAGLAWTPSALLDSLRGEAGLWAQEADLYRRKAASALTEATGSQQSAPTASAQQTAAAAAGLKLDPALAEVLLAAPLQALSSRSGGGASAGASADGGSAAAAGSPPELPPLDMAQYQRDYAALLKRERPYFEAAGTCGACGTAGDSGAALADRDFFDFMSYIQFKALARQVGASLAPAGGSASTQLTGWERMHAGSPEMQLRAAEAAWQDSLMSQGALLASGAGGGFGGSKEEQLAAAAAAYAARARQAAPKRDGTNAPPPLSAADALRLAVGASILAHVEADLAGASAGSARRAAALAAVRSTSPELDDVRAGAQALLAWFASKGLVAAATVEQFGLSLDEYENHYVWTLGEPAFLKYWLQAPATLRSSAALDQEEGFSQDYVAATLQAYFRRCGVAATSLKRYPSYSQPELVAEQWTLRRIAPLPDGYDWQQYREWAPDSCPGNDEDACY